MTTTATKRTITLSGRPPVRIIEQDWPILAQASGEWYEGQVRSQSFRAKERTLKVRQHADGRAIVYGVYQYSTAWQSESSRRETAGYLLTAPDTAEIIERIKRVAQEIGDNLDYADDETPEEYTDYSAGERGEWQRLGRECIADLPAEDI